MTDKSIEKPAVSKGDGKNQRKHRKKKREEGSERYRENNTGRLRYRQR